METKTGSCGWPLVPSKAFPGELTLACPKCKSTNIVMTVAPGFSPTTGFSIWMPGSHPLNICNDCKYRSGPAKCPVCFRPSTRDEKFIDLICDSCVKSHDKATAPVVDGTDCDPNGSEG